MHETFLIHSGTKGMKWGERRYQYLDGSYTELGKLRRRIPSSEINPAGPRIEEARRKLDEVLSDIDEYELLKESKNTVKKASGFISKKDGSENSQNDSKNNPQKEEKKGDNKKRPKFGTLVNDAGKAVDSVSKLLEVKKNNEKVDKLNSEIAKMSDSELKTLVVRLNLEKNYTEALKWKGSQKKKIALSDIFNAVSDTATVFATLKDFLKD